MRFTKSLEKDGEKIDICVSGHEIKREKTKKSLIFKKTSRSQVIIENKSEDKSIITLIPCPFCGDRNCSLIRSYTYHADEGETFFLNCLTCGKNFRSGSGNAQGS